MATRTTWGAWPVRLLIGAVMATSGAPATPETVAASPAEAAVRWLGDWHGEATVAGDATPMTLRLTTCGTSICGWWRLPDVAQAGFIGPIAAGGDASLAADPLALTLGDDAMTGRIRSGHGAFLDALPHGATADVALRRSTPAADRVVFEAIRFRSGAVELAGTVVRPPGAGPFPALVHLHGSGPATRSSSLERALRFADQGWASLILDKRGCGESGGRWLAASLDDLADDAAAAVAALASRADIDVGRIGLWGHSQAGWVAPRALRRGAAARFAILTAGGAVPPRDIERYDYALRLTAHGIDAAGRVAGARLVDAYLDYLGGASRLADIQARLDAASAEPWFSILGLDRVLPDESLRPRWAWVRTLEPADDLGALDVPLLVLLGGADRPALLGESVTRWNTALAPEQARRTRIVVLPGADHHLRVAIGSGWRRHHEAYWPEQQRWLEAFVAARRATGA